jgi:muconolactone delta-isomerase
MLILVLCRVADGAVDAEFRRHIPAETAALRELKASGVLAEAWSPGRPGAVLLLDVPSQAEAAGITAALPLAQAGLITTETIPLHPLDL